MHDMTIDKGVVLDHTLPNGELPHGYIQFHYNGTIKQAESNREQILKALKINKKLESLQKEIRNLRQNRAYDDQYWHLSFLERKIDSILGNSL